MRISSVCHFLDVGRRHTLHAHLGEVVEGEIAKTGAAHLFNVFRVNTGVAQCDQIIDRQLAAFTDVMPPFADAHHGCGLERHRCNDADYRRNDNWHRMRHGRHFGSGLLFR